MGLLARDPLGLDDEALLDLSGLGPGVVAGDLELLPAPFEQARQSVQASHQMVQVTDDMCVGHRLAEPVDGGLGLLRSQVSGLDPLLEKVDLGHQGVVLALEIRKRLLGGTGLPGPDGPFAVGGLDKDRAFFVDTSPRIGGAGHRCLLHHGLALLPSG